MKFGIIENGQVVEAPGQFKHIPDFPGYLELMYKNSLTDRMYGYAPIEELIRVTNEERIKKLEEENEKIKLELEVTQDALDQILFNKMEV